METTTTWGITVNLEIFQNPVTIKSSSENHKRFELKDFVMDKNRLKAAFSDWKITLPDELLDAMPKDTTVKKLIIDGSTTPKTFELEIAMTMGKLLNGKFDNLILVKPDTVRFYVAEESE